MSKLSEAMNEFFHGIEYRQTGKELVRDAYHEAYVIVLEILVKYSPDDQVWEECFVDSSHFDDADYEEYRVARRNLR